MPAHANMHQNMWQHVQPFNDDIFLVKKESKKKKDMFNYFFVCGDQTTDVSQNFNFKKMGKKVQEADCCSAGLKVLNSL